MGKRLRKWMGRLVGGIVVLTLLFCALGTFGIPAHEQTVFLAFGEASDRWQVNPEFRTAALEYCIKGSAATRAHLLGMPVGQIVMFARSLPGIPKEYAVNPTSQNHYDDFSRGPLSGYLHLSDEQEVAPMIGVMDAQTTRAAAAHRQQLDLSPQAMGLLLSERHMDRPVVNDSGAQESTANLFRDLDLFSNGQCHPFQVRGVPDESSKSSIVPLLAVHVRAIAAELHVPGDPKQMDPQQQQWVLDRLDSYVHSHDPELWRTKQLNDYFSGIWAQVYGPDYNNMLIDPMMKFHKWSSVVLIVLLTLIAIFMARRVRRKENPVEAPAQLEPAGVPA
jgi:hypothetical protein